MDDARRRLRSAVHLCVDMQRLFSPGGPWPTPWLERVLPNVVALVRHAPAHTIFTRFVTPRAPEDMSGAWRAFYRKWRAVTRSEMDPGMLRLLPALEPFAPPARVIDKTIFSAFADGQLHRLLASAAIRSVIVSGAETDMCVLASALGAIDLGYHVVIVRDAVCSSSDRSHDALVDLYETRFDVQISVSDTADILATWRP